LSTTIVGVPSSASLTHVVMSAPAVMPRPSVNGAGPRGFDGSRRV